jgi:glutamate dehydrogenase/leucine dehydrogenase
VFVCAALDNQVRHDNAYEVRAKILVELANGPVTPKADTVLTRNNVVVLPDILANAGGVTVSYFEWVQNTTQWYWTKDTVQEKLRTIMRQAFSDVWFESDKYNISLREGAYALGIRRVHEALRARGITHT